MFTAYPAATSALDSITFYGLDNATLSRNETDGTLYGRVVAGPGGSIPGGGAAVMVPNAPYRFDCGNTGDVRDVYGSAHFVGLGFVTFFTISARTSTSPPH